MRLVLLLAVLPLVLAACGSAGVDSPPPTPTDEPACSTSDGKLVYDLFEEYSQEWDNALAIASATGRVALSGPVSDLQDIRREVQRQGWPECASDAHRHLVNYMDGIIDSLLAFMQQKPESEVNGMVLDARKSEAQFISELRKLQP